MDQPVALGFNIRLLFEWMHGDDQPVTDIDAAIHGAKKAHSLLRDATGIVGAPVDDHTIARHIPVLDLGTAWVMVENVAQFIEVLEKVRTEAYGLCDVVDSGLTGMQSQADIRLYHLEQARAEDLALLQAAAVYDGLGFEVATEEVRAFGVMAPDLWHEAEYLIQPGNRAAHGKPDTPSKKDR